MRFPFVSVFVVALSAWLPETATRVDAGVVNVGVDGQNETIPDRAVGLKYKIHVDSLTLPEKLALQATSKIIFGAIRFHNQDLCAPGVCRLYQLETTLTTRMIDYNDIDGCPPWPDDLNGDVGPGISLLVNVVDHGTPRANALGIRRIGFPTEETFPRQSVGADRGHPANKWLTRIASWSQIDVTDKTMEVELTRGDPLEVGLGVHDTQWGFRFEPEPPPPNSGLEAACINWLPDGMTYRRWNLKVTIDATTYEWQVVFPENEAAHISVGRLEFGTESFEHDVADFSARYFDFAYMVEGDEGEWTPFTHFKVNSRFENTDVCQDPDIMTAYGWGVRTREFLPSETDCSIQFVADGESNDFFDVAGDTFDLVTCPMLPNPIPPPKPPAPEPPAGDNIADEGQGVASQSSTLGDNVAAFALDGQLNCPLPGGRITHTDQDDRAWWQVELANPALVSRVVVFNRPDCCQERLKNYDVLLSEDDFGDGPVDPNEYVSVHMTERAGMFEVIPISAWAKYVRVQLRSPSDYLQLAEVWVFADCDGCYDGNVCNGAETCDPDLGCQSGTPLTCSDGNACNGTETCNAVTGCQAGTPPTCNDGNVCNGTETCNAATGCQSGTPLSCSDGNACNGTETCNPSTGCQSGTPLSCSDGNVCNGTETCNSSTGCQSGTPLSCSDGNACNGTETCNSATGCQAGTPMNCNDGNVCTTDSCVSGSCKHVNNQLACNDNNPCTLGDMCYNGICQPSLLKTCPDVDNDPISWERCDVSTGNCIQVYGVQDTLFCGNGVLNPNWGEQCDDGNRVSGDCCSSTCKLEGPFCEDGNPCTFPDTCQGGPTTKHCVPGGCRPDFTCAEVCGEGLSCQGAGGCQCLE